MVLLFGYHTSTSGAGHDRARPVVAAPHRRRRPRPPRPAVAGSSTVTGAVAQTRWGPVQVRLTLAGGKITAVDVVQYPNGNGRDQEINADALPVLVQETI